MKFNYSQRLEKLRQKMQEHSVDAVVLGGGNRFDANGYYYSGDSAFPSVLLITKENAMMFSTMQAADLPYFFNVLPFKDWRKKLKQEVDAIKPQKVALDSRSDLLGLFAFAKSSYEKVNFTQQLLQIREKKDTEEIKLIKKAQSITKNAVARTLEENLAGLTENQVAGKIEAHARELNSSLDAFTPIVQSGERSAVFHNSASSAKLDLKTPLLIDVGCRCEFYCGDYTTTVYEGSDKFTKDALEAVRESQKQAQYVAEREKSGKKASETALAVLKEYGFSQNTYRDVGLGLGHSVGLEVHDGWRRVDDIEKTEKGMCFTIEPGLYFPKMFGVRFEDIAII
ncbi:MAG: Xaa-Pro peptidase family protein [Candidatus Micrarchaeota archaeon]